jgi:hypothetical protein
MLEIYRPGTELAHFLDPASEIAMRAGPLGPAGAVRVSLPIETKFGSTTTVDFAVGRFGGGHCVGFVRDFTCRNSRSRASPATWTRSWIVPR